jgi:hypothetical protein
VQGAAWLIAEVGLFVVAAATFVQLDGLTIKSLQMGNGDRPVPLAQADYGNTLGLTVSVAFFAGIIAAVADVVVGNVLWPEAP